MRQRHHLPLGRHAAAVTDICGSGGRSPGVTLPFVPHSTRAKHLYPSSSCKLFLRAGSTKSSSIPPGMAEGCDRPPGCQGPSLVRNQKQSSTRGGSASSSPRRLLQTGARISASAMGALRPFLPHAFSQDNHRLCCPAVGRSLVVIRNSHTQQNDARSARDSPAGHQLLAPHKVATLRWLECIELCFCCLIACCQVTPGQVDHAHFALGRRPPAQAAPSPGGAVTT